MRKQHIYFHIPECLPVMNNMIPIRQCVTKVLGRMKIIHRCGEKVFLSVPTLSCLYLTAVRMVSFKREEIRAEFFSLFFRPVKTHLAISNSLQDKYVFLALPSVSPIMSNCHWSWDRYRCWINFIYFFYFTLIRLWHAPSWNTSLVTSPQSFLRQPLNSSILVTWCTYLPRPRNRGSMECCGTCTSRCPDLGVVYCAVLF